MRPLLEIDFSEVQLREHSWHRKHDVDSAMYGLIFASACCGGALHGVAMAIRKNEGQGREKYWLHWRWWFGCVADALAGLLIWPAYPVISVQLLVPTIIVVQLLVTSAIGVLAFQERVAIHNLLGVICAVTGIIGLSQTSLHKATEFAISSFWTMWTQPIFIIANAACALMLVTVLAELPRSSFWALFAAFLEAIQYLSSRTIAAAAYECERGPDEFLKNEGFTVSGVFAIKGLMILAILHTQQLGLESDLSRFAGLFLAATTLFICIYGAAFFGDPVHMTVQFFASAASSFAGIWLLNVSSTD